MHVGDVDQPVGNRRGRNGPPDLVVLPDPARFGDVAAARGIDGVHVPDAVGMVGILPDAHEHAAAAEHGRGHAVVPRLGPHGVLRVQVESPELLAGAGVEGVEPAVAARERTPAGRRRPRPSAGGGPLAVQDALARRVVLPHDLAGVLVHGQEARCLRGDDLLVAAVAAVGRHDEDEVFPDDRRRSSP